MALTKTITIIYIFDLLITNFILLMSDKQYDSVLVGYCEEPRYYEENLSVWSVKFKDTELQGDDRQVRHHCERSRPGR